MAQIYKFFPTKTNNLTLFYDYSYSLSENLTGTVEGDIDMRTDVFCTDKLVELRLVEHSLYLFVNTRQYDLNALFLRHQAEVRKVVDTRGIDEGHLTHTDDTHFGASVSQSAHNLLELITGTEEVGTVDLVDLYALRNGEVFKVAQLEVAFLLGRVDLVADDLDIGRLSHTTHEEQTGADKSHLDGNGKVEDDCQQERHPEDNDIALGVLHNAGERTPSAHAIAHDDEYTSQTGHRDILRQRHEKEEDEQQYSSMDDTGYRRTSAIIDVGHGAGNGTCGRNTAKEWRGQVGHTLGYQLGIRRMAGAYDTVGYRSREQLLDGTEDGNGDGWRHQPFNDLP